jgi:hypothetical protein
MRVIIATILFFLFGGSVYAVEPCENEARKYSHMIARDSKSSIIEAISLIWFSETVSYGFKIKGQDHKIRSYLIKYSIVLDDDHDDLGKPDACRLMISGQVNQDGQFIYSKY